MAKKKAAKKDDPSFEDSLAELQEIVDALESGSLGLDESLTKFETGIGHLKRCQEFLTAAERRIELVTGVDEEGNEVTEPFDGTATPERKSTRPGNDLF